MSERDERDRGLGDMPYPPEYPKMPGEPKRVQPSKDTDRRTTIGRADGREGGVGSRLWFGM